MGTAWRPVLIVAAVAAVVHLAVALRYGWHRDELYYVTSGQHPAFGYVDQPPLTPVLAALAGNLLALRILALAAQVGCVVLTAMLAAELGGNRKAQALAAGCVAASPVFVGASLLFGTTVLDQVVWVAVFLTATRAVRIGTVRAWLLPGMIAGLGMENKSTVVVLLAGIGIGLLIFRRDVLRTGGPWLAAGLALVIALPNIIWEFANGWPEFGMAAVLSNRTGGIPGSSVQLVVLALLLAGPPLVAVWVLGARWLAKGEHRWLLVVVIVTAVVFTLSGGKSYYTAPVLALLFAAGAVWKGAAPKGWIIAVAATGVVAVFLTLPILPPSVQTHLRAIDPEPTETYGWPEFVDQVKRAEQTMPPGTPVFTSNYGEAGALTIIGGLANVYSGHNAYGDWGPPPGTSPTVLCVGEFTADQLRRGWRVVQPIAPITMPDGVQNEETTNHATIFRCEQPVGSWARMWPMIRHLS
ncbi:glycosyltransferase family 39 protein [Kutzneria sp. CA-103260]|uniref:glycosyltransferase family 39 protein n=1 Tax=Kutzneria sp. CA-103260 TaxID=2802641 RepID=UPI001BA49CE0|nr:glycosyltransferase family 39 protein [Kutzneria sp. CA-103260]QUQ66432.1 Dolichyl-phosphate-mannose-protein mannosyltransferase [Kutzneria sp. CA-103260]